DGVRPPEPVIIRVDKQTPVEVKSAGDATLRDLESGKSITLSALRGRPVVLVFFGPTADVNAEVLRYIRGASKHYAGRAEVIALLVDGRVDDARRVQLGAPVYDGRDALAFFGCSGPRVIVLDRAGAAHFNAPGWNSKYNTSINDELNRILHAKPN